MGILGEKLDQFFTKKKEILAPEKVELMKNDYLAKKEAFDRLSSQWEEPRPGETAPDFPALSLELATMRKDLEEQNVDVSELNAQIARKFMAEVKG